MCFVCLCRTTSYIYMSVSVFRACAADSVVGACVLSVSVVRACASSVSVVVACVLSVSVLRAMYTYVFLCSRSLCFVCRQLRECLICIYIYIYIHTHTHTHYRYACTHTHTHTTYTYTHLYIFHFKLIFNFFLKKGFGDGGRSGLQ